MYYVHNAVRKSCSTYVMQYVHNVLRTFNQSINEWMYERMNEWMYERMNEWMYVCMNKRISMCITKQIYEQQSYLIIELDVK